MDQYETKKFFKLILSVIGGLAIGFVTFFGFILLFLSIGLFGWSDGGEKDYLDRLETTTNITMGISIILGFIACFYFIFKINKPKLKEKNSSPSDTPSQ